MTEISVIIPAFNAGRYISNAIESVLHQPLADKLEIIIVNDGSTDSMESICQEYEKKFTQVHVFTQENQGASVARNTGISHACGTYLLFLDADDCLVENALDEKLLEEIKCQYGVIMFSSYTANLKRNRYGIDLRVQDAVVPGGRIFPLAGTFASCLYLKEMLLANDI